MNIDGNPWPQVANEPFAPAGRPLLRTVGRAFVGLGIATLVAVGTSSCGGGGGGSTAAPVAGGSCSNGATDYPTCTPPITGGTALRIVAIQFGSNGRIDAVAGGATITVPLALSEASTGLTAKLLSGPAFATLDGFNLKIDPSALPQAPATYPLVVSVIDSSNVERGRQAGTVEVSAVAVTLPPTTLVNGGTLSAAALGLTVTAPAGAFPSGSAQVQMRQEVDAQGNPLLRVTMSEANVAPLTLSASGATGLGGISSIRPQSGQVQSQQSTKEYLRSLAALAPQSVVPIGAGISGRQFYCDGATPGGVPTMSCALAWVDVVTHGICQFATAGSTPAISADVALRGIAAPTLGLSTSMPPVACPANSSAEYTFGGREMWSRLSAPRGWEGRAASYWQDKTPVLLVHGYNFWDSLGGRGLGGGTGTWGDMGSRLEAVTLHSRGGSRPAVFEFQWNTDAAFEDVADDLTDAIKWINATTGRKVVIIAHSFGGLAVRTALQQLGVNAPVANASNPPNKGPSLAEWPTLVDQLVTLGTPHSGVAPGAGGALPKGSDFVGNLTVYCGQVSCSQSGTTYGSLPIPNIFGRYRSSSFQYSQSGEIIEQLADLATNPFPNTIPIDSFIGLLDRTVLGVASPYTGDALISFDGQRFSTSLNTLKGSKLNQLLARHGSTASGAINVEERVLDALESRDRTSALAASPRGICHTWFLWAPSLGSCKFAEAHVEEAETLHPTWLALQRALGTFVQDATPSVPAVPTGLSPGSTTGPGPIQTSTSVTLSWAAVAGATMPYVGRLDEVATGNSVLSINTANTSVAASLVAGKQYRWFVGACNSTGCSSSAVYYFQTPPAGVGLLTVNGFAASYTGSTLPTTINLTGSGFNSVTQISWSCTMPSGSACPPINPWTSANWSGKFVRSSDTVATVSPTFQTSGDPTGTSSWTVTFKDAVGTAVSKSFTVTYSR